jgi:hypothetical protein
MTTPEITAALGISKVRLNELARKGKIPRGAKRGEWDLDAVRQALARNMDAIHKDRQAAAAPPTRTPVFDQVPPPAMDVPRGSLAAAQLVKAQADAKRAALEVRRLEKRLLDSDEVSGAWSGMIVAAKAKLLVLGDELADRLAAESNPVACREMVDRKIHEALSDLAEYPDAA